MICSLARSLLSNRYTAKFDALLLLWQSSDVYRRRGEATRSSVSGRRASAVVELCPHLSVEWHHRVINDA